MTDRGPIMVATDLSFRSDRPFERAALLSQQLGTRMIVLHVLDPQDEISGEDRSRVAALIESEFGAAAAAAELLLESGSVPRTVGAVAEERHCSLVITGVARMNSPGDYMLGNSVDHIIRRSSVPVLVVKRRPRKPYARLLVATDFSDSSRHSVVVAAELLPEAKIRLVHVYHSSYGAFLSHDGTEPRIHREMDDAMARFVASLPGDVRARVDGSVREGHLAAVIEEEVRGADLLVLSTHGRGGLAQATIGSQASDLLRYEPCDTLVVRKR